MTKQEQFLWIVQTAIIVNAVRLSTEVRPDREVTGIGLTGNWGAISDAIRASELIPSDMDADTAADEYCTFMLSNQRQAEMKAQGHPIICPDWMQQDRRRAEGREPASIPGTPYSPVNTDSAVVRDPADIAHVAAD